MLFDKREWQIFGAGFGVRDGAFGFNDIICFVLIEDNNTGRDPLPNTRMLYIKKSNPPGRRFGAVPISGFSFATVVGNHVEMLAVDTNRQVYYFGKNKKNLESGIFDAISNKTTAAVAITKVVRVQSTIYAIGFPDIIYKRIGCDEWDWHNRTMGIPTELLDVDANIRAKAMLSNTLNDLAGFSETDLYAVGDKGKILRFDGTAWAMIPFPGNTDLCTVACAEDGNVYITDQFRNIWKGRDSSWKLLVETSKTFPYADSFWFDDRLWFSNDYGMWVLEEDKVVSASAAREKPVPIEIMDVCGRIDISSDKKQMLICGQKGAALYDGKNWEMLFNRNSLE